MKLKKSLHLNTFIIFILLVIINFPYFLHMLSSSHELLYSIILCCSHLFVLGVTSIFFTNLIVSITINGLIDEPNKYNYTIMLPTIAGIKKAESLSNLFVILLIYIIYIFVVVFMPEMRIIVSGIFIAVYNLSVHLLPRVLFFVNNSAYIFNKMDNSLERITSYNNEKQNFCFEFSNAKSYDVVFNEEEVDEIKQKLRSINIQ